MDMIEKRNGSESYFEKLMAFGRDTEKRINLFEQHRNDDSTIDNVVNQVEDVLVAEYKNNNISKKTLSAIQKVLNKEKEPERKEDF